MTVVVDTSALVYASITAEPAATRLRHRLRDETVHAPNLIDAELGNVLRRQVARGALTPDHARTLLARVPSLVDHRYGHTGAIAAAAWALRDNLTFYDAIYVALATALGVPLVTTDRRLAAASRLPCRVETP